MFYVIIHPLLLERGDYLPKSISAYADPYKALEYRNSQRYRNYYEHGNRNQKRARKNWLPIEDKLVINHEMPDRELAVLLKRTVPAIQLRRHKLKSAPQE